MSSTVTAMLQSVSSQIVQFRLQNQELLPLNPGSATEINAKITRLRDDGLAVEIVEDRRFTERTVVSTNGQARPLAIVFLEAFMRDEVEATADVLVDGFNGLERFMGRPFPVSGLRVWYGFKLGASGGGGILTLEERQSYARRPASVPFDATVLHELAHSYLSNESLTQFLEMYLYNLGRGASADLGTWTHTRGHVGGLETNTGSAALLDVYAVLGAEAMSRSYQRLYPFHPPYGSALAPEVQQIFVEEAPTTSREYIAAKVARILF